jgi:hypothetical protein
MQLPDANIRSSSYYIAQTTVQCAHCGQWTRVLALAVPPGHEMLVEDEWQAVNVNAFLFYVTALPKSVQRHLPQLSTLFRPARSAGAADCYWVNHCEYCERLVSDDALHCEPGGFMPSAENEAETIMLTTVPQPFSAAAAGHAPDPAFFTFMRKR